MWEVGSSLAFCVCVCCVHALKWRYHDCILSSSVLHKPRGICCVSMSFSLSVLENSCGPYGRVTPPCSSSFKHVFILVWWIHWAFWSSGGPLAEDCCCLYPGSFLSPWQCWPFCKFLPLAAPKHDVFVSPVGTWGCVLAWLLMWPLQQFTCLTWRRFSISFPDEFDVSYWSGGL